MARPLESVTHSSSGHGLPQMGQAGATFGESFLSVILLTSIRITGGGLFLEPPFAFLEHTHNFGSQIEQLLGILLCRRKLTRFVQVTSYCAFHTQPPLTENVQDSGIYNGSEKAVNRVSNSVR